MARARARRERVAERVHGMPRLSLNIEKGFGGKQRSKFHLPLETLIIADTADSAPYREDFRNGTFVTLKWKRFGIF